LEYLWYAIFMEFNERLKLIRKKEKYTQEEFAHQLDVDYPHWDIMRQDEESPHKIY